MSRVIVLCLRTRNELRQFGEESFILREIVRHKLFFWATTTTKIPFFMGELEWREEKPTNEFHYLSHPIINVNVGSRFAPIKIKAIDVD